MSYRFEIVHRSWKRRNRYHIVFEEFVLVPLKIHFKKYERYILTVITCLFLKLN